MELAIGSFTNQYIPLEPIMQSKQFLPAAMLAAALSAAPAFAQSQAPAPSSSPGTSTSSGYQWPYQKQFWGYVGGSVGRTDYDLGCGAGCDDTRTGYKLFAGGKIKDAIGAEIAYVDLGKIKFAGGDSAI